MIENARTFDEPLNRDQVRSAGRAYGGFLRDMVGFPPEQLQQTIPDFHHTPKRYAAFKAALKQDAAGRGRLSRNEITFAEKRARLTGSLVEELAAGDLPIRTTHNDTKLNNVMMDDRTGAGICVVDLDTVMPGSALYDFGDAIRTIAVPAAEDERDLTLVNLDLNYFEAFTQGYLEAAGPILTPGEVDRFPDSAILMTLECGIRFLADHLNGDVYFKTYRENHNLDRCRTQFKLVQEMEAQYDRLARLVDRYR
jgi:Ser/Thr protein kinase RdoA (MazF antagonist)